jgi:hypothetical protein
LSPADTSYPDTPSPSARSPRPPRYSRPQRHAKAEGRLLTSRYVVLAKRK